ncbi:MAG: aldehyde dehydrogenase [Pseudorhodoplanes sp.]
MKRFQMLIDNKWVDAEGGKVFESVNPANGQPWALIPNASAADVDRAVRSAHRAFTEGPWARMLPQERAKYIRKLADLIVANSEEFGRMETIDTGKLLKETRWQANYLAGYYNYFAGLADHIEGAILPVDKQDMAVFTLREPLGVVAAIVPWNSQLFLTSVKLGPALAMGNTVVIKASEHASAAMLTFGRLIVEAGFPEGVVNIISGLAEPCGRTLTSHPLVDRVSFTGGPETARHIVRNSADNLAQVSLELGGKSPMMVFEDADLESTTNSVIAGNFGASGQSCAAGSRVYLQEKIADRFLEGLVSRARQIRIGDPLEEDTQMGPLATERQLTHIEKVVGRAVEQGAKVLHGGRRPSSHNSGYYYEPTILDVPDHKLEVVHTELFGPVMSVLRFRDEDEMLRLANDSKYGFAAGIFTQSGARQWRIAKGLRAGIIYVNCYRMVSPVVEFGGFKSSGYGREGGAQAIYDYTRAKSVWVNTSTEPVANPFVMR